jgi:hypothetical protein
MRWLSAEFGSDRMRSAPVVLPTREFFPDPYVGEQANARRILDRVCGWMTPPFSGRDAMFGPTR